MSVKAIAVLAAGAIIAICLRCNWTADYTAPLPNGYTLNRTSLHDVWILAPRPGGSHYLAVPPNIVEMNVVKSVVYGRVKATGSEYWSNGYFWLDTSTGTTRLGLDRKEWESQLKAMGIAAPKLHWPQRFRN